MVVLCQFERAGVGTSRVSSAEQIRNAHLAVAVNDIVLASVWGKVTFGALLLPWGEIHAALQRLKSYSAVRQKAVVMEKWKR